MEVKKKWRVSDGTLSQCTHFSESTQTPMTFSIFVPGEADPEAEKLPTIYYLSGLTCTDENFCQKAGPFRAAARRQVVLVAPDTSPRGANIEGEDDSYDFGSGAGFYLNATREPWSKNYKMYDYVLQELPALVQKYFPVDPSRESVMGHSMGGHGALTIAMKNPERFRSVSAFAAVCHPTECPWGKKAFAGYLGDDVEAWKQYDAVELMRERGPFSFKILMDQGDDDGFYKELQLLPESFIEACSSKGQELEHNFRAGYDHSYFFISTFVEDHINFHADQLGK